jgi:tetratricopeptide (TPR) repeat protein
VGHEAGAATSQEESFTAWRRFCSSLAASGPCVVVFEDVHWADDAMLDFVAQLARSDEPVPLLVVCSARPELLARRPDWAHAAARAISLDPLTSEQTEQLVQGLLEGADVDPVILDELVTRADGNPLYAEQFARVARSGTMPAAGLPDSVEAVIAARLDVLASLHKNVLQDAAVVGHVFWSGAVSAIGAREPRNVEADLDALAEQQFVRLNADSSMQDDHEFSFWHAIVRDVCYLQIPRAARADRHRRAAAWIELRAGPRLEDLADVLAHHHTQALSLDEARGQVEDADRDAARRFLVLSGDRGMALNVVQAEAAYARALELTPPGHPDRPMVLVRHGDALRQNGRMRDAEAALAEAVAGFRAAGATLELGRALIALAEVLFFGIDSRVSEVTEQARRLFEELPPGADLIEVYAQLAAVANGTNDYDGIEHWFQRTREVCTTTGLPMPARVQAVHGMMRVSRGERAGLDEIRAAVSAAESEGNYGRALVARNNLILDQWIFDGPATVFADAVEATERGAARGITAALYFLRGLRAELRFRTGDWTTALDEQSVLADELAANGVEVLSASVRSAQVMTMVRLGLATDAVRHLDGILSCAREVGNAQMFVEVAPVLALALATTGAHEQAHGVLTELIELPGSCEDTALVRQFPALIRATLACGDTGLGERFVAAMQRGTPAQEHGLQAALALLAEARGDMEEAATRHADAARRWREFGDLSELTPALIGLARCTDDPGRRHAALTEALPLLTTMGDAPLLAEARALAAAPERPEYS